jgi:hypothetical protein
MDKGSVSWSPDYKSTKAAMGLQEGTALVVSNGVQELSRDNDLAAQRWVEAGRAYNAALKAPLSKSSTMECPTCAERGYDNADYHRLHRAWCDSVAEIERLRTGIADYLSGDYPNPRCHRPNNCPHGRPYSEDCGRCDSEHFQRLLTRESAASQASSS